MADAYLNRGIALSRKSRNLTIIDFYEAIRITPEFVEAYYQLGLIRIAQEEYPQAIEDLTKAIRLNSIFSKAYLARARAYNSLVPPNLESANFDWDKAIEFSGDPEGIYMIQAIANRRNQQYSDAIVGFTKAIALLLEEEDSAAIAYAYLERGITYRQAENIILALIDLNKSIAIDSTQPQGYIQRGITLRQNGEEELSVKDFDKALDLDPNLDVTNLIPKS